MRSSVFGKWVISHPAKSHFLLPAFLGLSLVAMYFSTLPLLQDLVAPGSGRPPLLSLAGRGVLELLQVFILLCVFFFLMRCLMMGRGWVVQLWILLLLLGMAGVFMEEVDLGTTLLGLVSGQMKVMTAQDPANSGMAPLAGETVAGYVKLAFTVLVLLVFFLAALMLGNSRNRTLRLLAPPPWVLVTVLAVVAVDRLAAFLHGAGLGTINGVRGPLAYDIAEFRELLIYYLMLVYVAGLHERVVVRQ